MEGVDRPEEGQNQGFVHIGRVLQGWAGGRLLQSAGLINHQMSGYPDLDQILGDFGNHLIVVGGKPRVGKSTLALNICANAAYNGSHVGIVSLDLSHEQLAMRFLSSDAEVDFDRLRLGLLTQDEEKRILQAIDRLSGFSLHIDDGTAKSVAEIRSTAQRWSSERWLDLLIVDYLQLVTEGSESEMDRNQEIDYTCRSLKSLAWELKTAIILCSQLDVLDNNPTGRRPRLLDLPDTVDETADVVLFIHRDDLQTTEEEWEILHPEQPYPRNVADIIVAKNRYGPTGTIQLEFRDNLLRFDPKSRETNQK